ncbi:transcriptional regulator, TetR family [Thioclava dalianensis]|nr:TetR/AcrR family transcriptional regulator [Thioclava dalianensis]SFN72914.1 transcriptional regulator, TetR family [Thioclava dalianensis]
MKMATCSLRERRRRETSREIQKTAIELALDLGLDEVTTDMISQRAGISARTFFNYYPNKIAAIAGDPPRFEGDYVEIFLSGAGPLTEDLKIFLSAHLRQVTFHPAMMDKFTQLLRQEPKVRDLHDIGLDGLRKDLARIIESRLPSPGVLTGQFLAQVLIGFIKILIEDWSAHPEDSLEQRLENRWPQFLAALKAITT